MKVEHSLVIFVVERVVLAHETFVIPANLGHLQLRPVGIECLYPLPEPFRAGHDYEVAVVYRLVNLVSQFARDLAAVDSSEYARWNGNRHHFMPGTLEHFRKPFRLNPSGKRIIGVKSRYFHCISAIPKLPGW